MNQRFTYSIPPHTLSFPATADRICVAEPRPHTYGVRHLPCGPLATEPCRPTACNPSIPPHTLSFPATADRISAEVFQLTRVSARTQTPPTPHPCSLFYPTANYSLLTANSTDATPARPAHPILNSSFFILNWTYTFSAKEKDPETGLSYFGSRYYSSDLSVWLSVDPMAAKYPSLSPYVYCANNPVKLVDPNGEEITDYYDITTGEHLLHVEDGIDEAIAVHRPVFNIFYLDGTLSANRESIGYSLGSNSDFVDLAGTIYAESDSRFYSLREAAGIGSVIRNRAMADRISLCAEASKGGIYGWSNRGSILTSSNQEKVNISYRAAMLTITGDCDYSCGGFFWQGRDFASLGSPANNQFYQNGFLFKKTDHDIYGMGNDTVSASWQFKYESTAAAGRTVFMRLTDAWKNAQGSTKWHGGR